MFHKGDLIMVSNFRPHREPLHNVLMVLLLFLAGLVSACSPSNTSGSSPTPTSTQGIRGIFHEYALPPSQFVPGSITAGPDGDLWFTEIGPVGSSIGRITTSGKITEFPLPSANTFPSSITAGSDGNIWFTGIGTNNGPSKIGVITPQGKIREFTLPHYILGSITRGPDGNLWFDEFQYSRTGTTAAGIGRITTAGNISDFPLPTSSNSPTSITFGTDHTLWFIAIEVTPTDPNGKNGKIGHLV